MVIPNSVLTGRGATAARFLFVAPAPLKLFVSRHMQPMLKLVIAVFTVLSSVAWSAEDEVLGPDKWPTSVAETVKDIVQQLPEKDKEVVRITKKEDLIKFHHGWGTGIRNHYGLWRGNDNLILSACGKPCHPDDASMVIIEAVWSALQK